MDALAQTLWLCTAVLVAAASALSAIDHVQRGYRGFQWWVGALWLNAGGAGVMALLDASNSAPPMLQSLFVPWPLLCLLGLRQFHARCALPAEAQSPDRGGRAELRSWAIPSLRVLHCSLSTGTRSGKRAGSLPRETLSKALKTHIW